MPRLGILGCTLAYMFPEKGVTQRVTVNYTDILARALISFSMIAAPVIVAGILSRHSAEAKPAAGNALSGRIAPGKRSAWFTVLGGGTMVIAGMVCLVMDFVPVLGGLLALFGAIIAGFMAPSLTSRCDVYWTDAGVQGPSKLFGPALGAARTSIGWPDIVKTGKSATGYWYVEGSDGSRIYWSYLYPGYRALTAALRLHCPHVVLWRDLK